MWHDLREEVELEMAMLGDLADSVRPLLLKCAASPPDVVETMALGAFLHSFYNGIENAFKRIAIRIDGGLPRGVAWHQELLTNMNLPNAGRPAVISADLKTDLTRYLDFRHLFRHLYASHLEWDRMADLVHDCEQTLTRVVAELDAFLRGAGDRP